MVDLLSPILQLWEELLCVQDTSHGLLDLMKLVGDLDTQCAAGAVVDDAMVRALYIAACTARAEWAMCCLLRRLGQLKRSGLVEVVWLARALACWAAVVQGDCSALFTDGTATDSAFALRTASWVALVEALCKDDVQTAHGEPHTRRMEAIAARVLVALLGWDNAELALLLTPDSGSPSPAAPLQTSADIVEHVRAMCRHCALDRFPLPALDGLRSFSMSYSGSPSPRPRAPPLTAAAVCEQARHRMPSSPEPSWPSSQASESSSVTAAEADDNRTPDRHPLRRGTLPPASSTPSCSATRRPAARNGPGLSPPVDALGLGEGSPNSPSIGSDSTHGTPITVTAAPTPALTPPKVPSVMSLTAPRARASPTVPARAVTTPPTSTAEESEAATGHGSGRSSSRTLTGQHGAHSEATPSVSDHGSTGKPKKAKATKRKSGNKKKKDGDKSDGCRAS